MVIVFHPEYLCLTESVNPLFMEGFQHLLVSYIKKRILPCYSNMVHWVWKSFSLLEKKTLFLRKKLKQTSQKTKKTCVLPSEKQGKPWDFLGVLKILLVTMHFDPFPKGWSRNKCCSINKNKVLYFGVFKGIYLPLGEREMQKTNMKSSFQFRVSAFIWKTFWLSFPDHIFSVWFPLLSPQLLLRRLFSILPKSSAILKGKVCH